MVRNDIIEALEKIRNIPYDEWESIKFALSERETVVPKEAEDKIFKNQNVNDIIAGIILEMGIPANILGWKYLIKAIELVVNDPEKNRITKQIYPIVAQTYETTSSRVERAIRHAAKRGWNNDFAENLKWDIFGNTIKESPTNTQFIFTMANYIRRNM